MTSAPSEIPGSRLALTTGEPIEPVELARWHARAGGAATKRQLAALIAAEYQNACDAREPDRQRVCALAAAIYVVRRIEETGFRQWLDGPGRGVSRSDDSEGAERGGVV